MELPIDIHTEILKYMTVQTVCSYSRTNKKLYQLSQPYLKRYCYITKALNYLRKTAFLRKIVFHHSSPCNFLDSVLVQYHLNHTKGQEGKSTQGDLEKRFEINVRDTCRLRGLNRSRFPIINVKQEVIIYTKQPEYRDIYNVMTQVIVGPPDNRFESRMYIHTFNYSEAILTDMLNYAYNRNLTISYD